ncbi:MAG: prenyltransferase/squalene oxidase repeat-containing protein [Candidatus Nanopelagicales bacterium]
MFTKPLITAGMATALLFTAAPAMADDTGLYGAADPAFDGAYRQSLSILALTAAGKTVPRSATRWLRQQQCDDGGFVAYRADTGPSCPAPDPVSFAGQDTNSTATAAAALLATGNRKAARQAVAWLVEHRDADGGWAYYPGAGATADTNSTALANAAVAAVRGKQKNRYLRTIQLRCSAPKKSRGALAFDASLPEANDNATSQAAWMLGGGLTLPTPGKISKSSPRLTCSGKNRNQASVKQAALGYLSARLLAVKGRLPYGGGYPGTDYAGAASATLALANARAGRKAVKTTTRFLKSSADDWITANGQDAPGPIAMLILLAHATGENPKDFGGTNLIKRLAKSQTR